jgi:hypothetical protein
MGRRTGVEEKRETNRDDREGERKRATVTG